MAEFSAKQISHFRPDKPWRKPRANLSDLPTFAIGANGLVRRDSSRMDIYGIDFTSAPKQGKPITCAEGGFLDDSLVIRSLRDLVNFGAFEAFLKSEGPWIVGIDFPFGQSRKLITNLGWPQTWARYVAHVAQMEKKQFEAVLKNYKRDRSKRDKEHGRITDTLAGSKSPQKLYGVPVGKMFFEGAPRLLKSPASIVPVRPRPDDRIAVEAYPKLVARCFIDKRPYKSDGKKGKFEQCRGARCDIVNGLRSSKIRSVYGFDVVISTPDIERLVEDPKGDQLDAVLCAVQAAWAYTRRKHNYCIPADVDTLEGWIVDPALLNAGEMR